MSLGEKPDQEWRRQIHFHVQDLVPDYEYEVMQQYRVPTYLFGDDRVVRGMGAETSRRRCLKARVSVGHGHVPSSAPNGFLFLFLCLREPFTI